MILYSSTENGVSAAVKSTPSFLSKRRLSFYNRQHYGAVMLYGHVHNTREWELVEKWKQELLSIGIPARIINVGCMMDYMDYAPRTLDELLAACSDKSTRTNQEV